MTTMIEGAAAAAKVLLRLQGDSEDALLARLASVAVELGEAFCGLRLTRGPCEDVLTGTGRWQWLRQRPVSAIGAVTAATGANGAGETGVGASGGALRVEEYAIDIDGGMGRVRVPAGRRVTVSYTAGLAADWETLAPPIAHGAVLLAAHLFENRNADQAPPAAVTALWRPYRWMRL